MDINKSDEEVPLLTQINDLYNGFCQLTLDNKKWIDERLKEKNMIGKYKTHNLQPLPEEISVYVHNERPKRKALLEASIKIRMESQNSNLTKGKKSTKIINSTVIKGKEDIPDFPNISIVESIEEEKEEKSQINVETVELTNELLAVSDNDSEFICKSPQKSQILNKQTKKSSKELFNPYIVNSVKKRVEAFEILQENEVAIPSPEPFKMPMRITRTKTKQLQEEQSKQNTNSIKDKQQMNILSPNNDKKISQAEQDKIEKAIQKKNERLNLIKDDLKKKNNKKMIKAFNIREAHEKEKQHKIRENEEKITQQEQRKKISEQKRVAQKEKKLELKKIQNLKKKKEIEKKNQNEELKVSDDNIIVHSNPPNEKKLISNNTEDLQIKLLQSEINRAQPAAINNATFVQKKQNNEHTLQEEEVELVEDDDEEEEEIDGEEKKFIFKHGNHKQVPIWAQYQIRNQNMLQQAVIMTNIFGPKDLKNIIKIFPEKTITRQSSAIWNIPVTEELP